MSIGEVVLAFLVVEFGVLQKLLGTTPLHVHQWLLAIAPAALLLFLWEIGKVIARRMSSSHADVSTPGDGDGQLSVPGEVRRPARK